MSDPPSEVLSDLKAKSVKKELPPNLLEPDDSGASERLVRLMRGGTAWRPPRNELLRLWPNRSEGRIQVMSRKKKETISPQT
ncbi:MAG: hypothetical protein LBJ64_11485 [Deltaproteobacteria bacterium]|nr:hypothetical protein [Deltaproteobacteria bacterium]